ncbi:MAG: hypothetical protein MUE81_11760 [Thermoflexibacter sp.]|jgi:hypothetical protein|nr:hypothetical protein [Thermoflexibacter sp.]
MTKILFTISCAGETTEKTEQYPDFKQFLQKEVKLEVIKEKKSLIFLLQGTNCSCQDANLRFANELISKSKEEFNLIVIAKDDEDNKIKNSLVAKDKLHIYFEDRTQLLEKHGSIFVGDKVFILDKGVFTHVFKIDKDNYEIIEETLL